LVLQLTQQADPMVSMRNPLPVGELQEANPSPVVGRIDARPNDLFIALEEWLSYLRQLRKSDKTIIAYRQLVKAAARDLGWTSVSDLTFSSITRYLGSKLEGGDWKTGSYNRNLTGFRSFTKWLTKSQRFDRDPLDLAANATQTDAGPSSRAATTAEARALISVAKSKVESDRRSAGDRPARYLTLFLAGLRWQEPALLQWGDIHLDDDVPHIHWRPAINKNRREQWVALCPELIEVLRKHRQTVPHDQLDPIFPRMLNRDVWCEDKKRALISKVDNFGMPFTPRSARQWFDTTLTDAGVPDRMVRKVMRHAVDTPDRYYKPDLAQQAAALALLPRLGSLFGNVDNSARPGIPPRMDLTTPMNAGNITPPVCDQNRSQNNSKVPGPSVGTDWRLTFAEGSGTFEVLTTLPWFDELTGFAGRTHQCCSPGKKDQGHTFACAHERNAQERT
jgi:integrase